MKMLALVILFVLSSVAIQAGEAHLKESQVQAIASLVTTEIYHAENHSPSPALYEKATGIWSCITSSGAGGDHGYLFIIRDKDAFYTVNRWESKRMDNKFHMNPSPKKRIAEIIKAKG